MFSDGSHFRRAIRYVGNVFGEVFHDGLSGALSMLSLVVVDGVELFCAVDSFCLEGIFLPREWSKDPPPLPRSESQVRSVSERAAALARSDCTQTTEEKEV